MNESILTFLSQLQQIRSIKDYDELKLLKFNQKLRDRGGGGALPRYLISNVITVIN